MQKTTRSTIPFNERSLVDNKGLQEMLSCGRVAATKIGENANAKCRIGRRVLWNVRKINDYLEQLGA